MRKYIFLMSMLLVASSALAAEVGGVKLDDKVGVGGQELVLNGAGIRTRAFFKAYVGSLYVPAKAGDLAAVLARGPRRVEMNLLRNLKKAMLGG
jgi:long-chain acyl-CoA synthetase